MPTNKVRLRIVLACSLALTAVAAIYSLAPGILRERKTEANSGAAELRPGEYADRTPGIPGKSRTHRVAVDKSDYTNLKEEGYPLNVNPEHVSAKEAPLEEGDLVMGVVLHGEARAYPVNYMMGPFNEVINDSLGGQPVAPTWWPTDHSGVVYDRTISGRELEFGVIGQEKGTLIMYDAQTRSWWSQLFGQATTGPMKGEKLVKLPSTMTTWKKWKALHPDTTVYIKRSIPYHRLSDFTETSFANLAKRGDGPVEATDLVIGVEGHLEARAYLLRDLAKKRVLNDALETHPIVVFLGEDFATARVLDRAVDGKIFTFSLAEGDRLQDAETGSLWDPMSGEAIAGSLKGKRLKTFVSTYSLWYAWKRYRPDTELVAASQ